MKKIIIALSLLVFISSCQRKKFTCYCTDGNKNLVFKKTMSDLNYSDFSTYCASAQEQYHQAANNVTCTVLDKEPEEETKK